MIEEHHNGHIYNLAGDPVSQAELATFINDAYGTNLTYKPVSVDQYLNERKHALGDFMGIIVAGIYEAVSSGAFDTESHFTKVTGRGHKTVAEMILNYKENNK